MTFSFFKSLKDCTDSELIQEYKDSGDLKYVSELFLRYKDLVFGVCLKYFNSREESKDITMEVYEELIKKIPHQEEIRNFKSWLYVMVRNHCLMILRSKQKHIQSELSEKDEPIVVEFPLEMNPIEKREVNYMQLEAALDRLEKKQKQCIRLFYLEDKSYKEITELTGFELKEVKSYIQNGKRKLKINLDAF